MKDDRWEMLYGILWYKVRLHDLTIHPAIAESTRKELDRPLNYVPKKDKVKKGAPYAGRRLQKSNKGLDNKGKKSQKNP